MEERESKRERIINANGDAERWKRAMTMARKRRKRMTRKRREGSERAEVMVPHVGGGRAGAERLGPSRERRSEI